MDMTQPNMNNRAPATRRSPYPQRQSMGDAWQLGAGPRPATPAPDRNSRAVQRIGVGAWLRDFFGITS